MTEDILKTIKDNILLELRDIPGVDAVYLFGSSVNGKMTGSSDIDLAILFSENKIVDIDKLDIMSRFSSVAGRDVDIVILNDASSLLYHEILLTGKLILEKNRECRIQREVRNRKFYEDYRHIHSIYMMGMRKRHG